MENSSSHELKPRFHLDKKRLFDVLEQTDRLDKSTQILRGGSICFIIFTIFVSMAETSQPTMAVGGPFFMFWESFATIIFTIEYVLRIWLAPLKDTSNKPLSLRIAYLKSPIGIIDLFTIIPFLLHPILQYDYTLFILFRIPTMIKLFRYMLSYRIIIDVIIRKKEALLITILIEMILLYVVAALAYYAEFDANPEQFPNLFTSMYWAGITLASVGYGELVPITALGKIIATAAGFLGIAFYALPATILGSSFYEELQKQAQESKKCPKCQKQLTASELIIRTKPIKSSEQNKPSELEDQFEEFKVSPPPMPQTPYQRVQAKVSYLLNSKYPTDLAPKIVSTFIFILILLNAFELMVESNPDISPYFGKSLYYFEVFSVIIFLIEYLARVWVTPFHEDPDFRSPVKGRLRYMATPMLLIDLFAILPFFIPFILPFNLRFIRVLRLFRIFRVFKIGHFSEALNLIINLFKERRYELYMALGIAVGLWFTTSIIMYYFEREMQPEKFTSVPATLWWGIATLATIGYGDLYPVTTLGRMWSVLTGYLGVGLFALPTGIMGAAFVEQIEHPDQSHHCPYCNTVIH